MRYANTLAFIQERERLAIQLSEKYRLEKDPVKKKILRYRIESYLEAMIITTRAFCGKSGSTDEEYTFEEYMKAVKRAYDSEEYLTVGDIAGLVPTKFRILEPLNPKPYEEPVSSCGVIP